MILGFVRRFDRVLGEQAEQGFHLIQELFDLDDHYNSATELITFIDNHDMTRFQTLNPEPDILRLAIDLLSTVRGIPCVYYGTEQYLHNDTDGGNDPYNRPMMELWAIDTPIYRDIQILSHLRRSNPAVALGSQWTRYVTPQVYCFSRHYRDSHAFIAINQGEQMTIENVSTGLPDGDYICLLARRRFHIQDGHLNHST